MKSRGLARLLKKLVLTETQLASPRSLGSLGHARSFSCSGRKAAKFSSPIPEFENKPGIATYDDLHKFSLQNPDEFWGTLARSRLRWMQDFKTVRDCDLKEGRFSWFLDGKLNVSDNCVDRHYEQNPDKVALIWEKDEPGVEEYITYRQLYGMINQMCHTFAAHEVKKHDKVVIYLPVSPIAVAAMLACARIGAVHSVVFAGFSAEALASRIQDAQAQTVITADEGVRGGKTIPLKKVVNDAVAKCSGVKRVFVARRTGNDYPRLPIDIPLEEDMAKHSTDFPAESMDSEDFLFLLYTSGSTGKPKGIVHTQAGYLLYTQFTLKTVFDYNEGDIFACVADIGWITGHSYAVYGALSNGATSVLFESTPTYPDPGRYWEMVERLKINQFYGSPTALRLLLQFDDSFVTKYNRSTLKTLGCVGEPLNHEAWEWYYEVVGERRCPIVDTWWQSETGGHCITPRPSAPDAPILPAMPMRPFLGIQPVLAEASKDSQGKTQVNEILGNDQEGALCLKTAWPGMARTIYGDHQRFIDTYFREYPGYFFTGDGAHRDEHGYYRITGRMDDVINTSGHRLGTAEVEDVIDEHHLAAESAVVGFPHKVKGEGIYAFVTLKRKLDEPPEEIIQEIKAMVKQNIASYAVPDMIQIAPGLPKTRSGKIMRRILKKIAADNFEDLGDTSTLSEPAVVKELIANHKKLLSSLAKSEHKKGI